MDRLLPDSIWAGSWRALCMNLLWTPHVGATPRLRVWPAPPVSRLLSFVFC